MSVMEKAKNNAQGIGLSGVLCGAISMMITLLMLLGVSWLIASGKVDATRENLMIMLSVFLGVLLGVVLLRPGKTGESLPFALIAVGSYIAILIVMEMSVGTARLFSSNMLRLDVCAVVGAMLGITLKSGRSGRAGNRRRKR